MSAITMLDATEPLEPVDWDQSQTSQVWGCLKRRKTRRGFPRLSDNAVLDIRRRYAEGQVTQQQLADEYGIARSWVSHLVNMPAVTGEEDKAA